MKRINIYIGNEQHKRLIALVKQQGRSGYSEFVRIAIDQYLEKNKKRETIKDLRQS